MNPQKIITEEILLSNTQSPAPAALSSTPKIITNSECFLLIKMSEKEAEIKRVVFSYYNFKQNYPN